VTGDGAGGDKASEAKTMAGTLPYLTLAEIGYFAQVMLTAADFVLLAATVSMDYSSSIPPSVVEAFLGLAISVAWLQLGRRVGNSWFQATGVFGGASVVLGLAVSLMPGVGFFVLAEIETFVSLAYFVFGVGAFFSAARVFRVRLFRYVGYLLVVGFLVTFIAGIASAIMNVTPSACVPLSAGQSCSVQNGVALAGHGLAYLVSGGTSVVAGVGFRRARGIVGLSDLNREG